MLRIFLFSCFFCATCSANVTIEYSGNTLSYSGNPRLETVLASLVRPTDYYWPNAHLFDLNDSSPTKMKKAVLKQLDIIKSRTGKKTQKWRDIESMRKQISVWNIAQKVPLYLDYDLARIREEYNPRLDDGAYSLFLPYRSNNIFVFGAVESEVELVHLGATEAKVYLSQIKRLDYADSEYIYIIRPNGEYIKYSTGIHNNNHIEVSPGGAIFIPVRELPFDSINKNLNEMIAKLAGNRLP